MDISDDESAELLVRFRQGDQQAADELFHRYVLGLVRLARARLSRKVARRLDPEDVVQSAYRSFFHHARRGRYVLHRSGDLWRLLAAITLNKLYGQVERHTAAKRAVDRERSIHIGDSAMAFSPDVLAREPSPSEVLVVTEELEDIMRGLIPSYRRILQLRLQGHPSAEIAAKTDRSERTVNRCLEKVRKQLQRNLSDSVPDIG